MKRLWNKFKAGYALFFRLFGEYKTQIVFLIGIGVVSGLLGGLGIGALIPLISFAIQGGELGNDFVSHFVQKILLLFEIPPSLHVLLTLISVIFILKAVMLFIFSYFTIRISNDCENNYRRHFYKATLKAGWPYLLEHKIGHLENMLMVHVESAPRLMNLMSNIFLNFTNFFVYLLLAFRLSPLTTGLAFLTGGVLLLISYPLVMRTKKLSRLQSSIFQFMAHEVNENVTGLKTIKAMNIEQEVSSRAVSIFEKLKENKLRLFFVRKINSISIEPLGIIFVAIIFNILFTRSVFDLGVFAVLIYLIQKIFAFVEDLQGSFHSLNVSLQFVQRLFSYEDEIIRYRERDSGKKSFFFEREFEFKKIKFMYPKRKRPVLDGISFKIRKGEMVGIIGPSGAGKTTIVDLLLRLFEPQSGEILIDGNNVKEISLKSWRRNVGYVSQDIFLKNDTVFSNIKFYDESITAEEVYRAAKAAYLHDLVKSLPNGFDTMVGERGSSFSAGERQRIILARVFARRPKILILDEATSSLDNESEAMIKKAVRDLKGETTVIAIAHRLSTIMNADRLIVLEKGQIAEEGIPEELLREKSSYFYRVYNIIQEGNG